jgi:hypothetical protein
VATTLVVSAFTRLHPRTRIALSTADWLQRSAASLGAAWSIGGYDARLFQHASASIHAYTFSTTADSLQLSAAQSGSLSVWLRRSLFQHAHASIHAHALLCPLQIHSVLRAAQSRCCLSVAGYDARVSTIAPSAHTHCSVHCRLAAVQCSKSLCHLEHWWLLTLVVSSMHPPQSAHMHCLSTAVHCSPVQHSFGGPEREWLRRSLFQHAHASIHAHALLCPL